MSAVQGFAACSHGSWQSSCLAVWGHGTGWQLSTEIERCSWCFSLWWHALWNCSPAEVLKEDNYVMCHWKWQYAFRVSCWSCFLKRRNLLSYLGLLQSVFISNICAVTLSGPGWCWLKWRHWGWRGAQKGSISISFWRQDWYWIWDALDSASPINIYEKLVTVLHHPYKFYFLCVCVTIMNSAVAHPWCWQ